MRTSVSSRPAHLLLRLAVVLLLALGVAPVLTSQPAAAAESSITINSHSCPSGTDMAASIFDLAAACQGQPALDYTINGPGFAEQVSAGLYTASGLEPGTYFVTQGDYSATYGPPVAYCSVDDALGNDVLATFPVTVTGSGQTPIELAVDGYMAFCDVFNAEATPAPEPSTDAEVFVSKWACPEGTTSTDYTDLLAACTTELEGVEFAIEDFADDRQTDDTGGQPARASFTAWKIGGATITETIPDGYGEPVVYCYAADEFGTVLPGADLANYPATGGRISIDIPADPNGGLVSFFCEWFNIPGGGAPTDDAEVFISKWACPPGFSSDDQDELAAACTEELEGIDFAIEHMTGETATDDTGGQPARAAFTPWFTGSSTITESVPDGYGEPKVVCGAMDEAGDYLPGYEPTEYAVTGGGSVDVDIPPAPSGEIVSFLCDWYNLIDEPTVAGIYVHKYGCPRGTEADATFEELAADCLTIVRGAEFEVEGPDGYAETQTSSGIDLAWENLAPGDYSVTETPPTGYRDSVVFCATGAYAESDAGDYEEVDVSDDGGIDASLEGGAYLDCVWYNLPAPASTSGTTTPRPTGPATLVIVKFTCDEEYDLYAPKANPTKDCDEETDGVAFTLSGARDSSVTKVTGEDDDPGTATFADLPAGSYLLQEEYPEDVSAAFIWDCTSTVRLFDYPFTPFATIGPDGRTKVSLVPGEVLSCVWYDVPSAEATGEGNLRVAILDCPGDLVNEASCEPASDGVTVTLVAPPGGDNVELVSDDDGVAAGEVEPSRYEIEVEGGICFADSDAFSDDGDLDIGDDPVEVTIYRCEE